MFRFTRCHKMGSARRASWLVEVHLSGLASPVAKATVLIQTSVCRRVLSVSDSDELKLFDFHILCWALPCCWLSVYWWYELIKTKQADSMRKSLIVTEPCCKLNSVSVLQTLFNIVMLTCYCYLVNLLWCEIKYICLSCRCERFDLLGY